MVNVLCSIFTHFEDMWRYVETGRSNGYDGIWDRNVSKQETKGFKTNQDSVKHKYTTIHMHLQTLFLLKTVYVVHFACLLHT